MIDAGPLLIRMQYVDTSVFGNIYWIAINNHKKGMENAKNLVLLLAKSDIMHPQFEIPNTTPDVLSGIKRIECFFLTWILTKSQHSQVKIQVRWKMVCSCTLTIWLLPMECLCNRFKSRCANLVNFKSVGNSREIFRINGCNLGLRQKSRGAVAPL